MTIVNMYTIYLHIVAKVEEYILQVFPGLHLVHMAPVLQDPDPVQLEAEALPFARDGAVLQERLRAQQRLVDNLEDLVVHLLVGLEVEELLDEVVEVGVGDDAELDSSVLVQLREIVRVLLQHRVVVHKDVIAGTENRIKIVFVFLFLFLPVCFCVLVEVCEVVVLHLLEAGDVNLRRGLLVVLAVLLLHGQRSQHAGLAGRLRRAPG